ncbi:MAG: GNAT family N-acetyltransferase [Ilumatobacteraceae bacterium]
MHLAESLELPAPYAARPYRGREDHPAMAGILDAHRQYMGDPEMPTAEDMDVTYAHLTDCDVDLDICVIGVDGRPVAYSRASREDLDDGWRDCVIFSPTQPDHIEEPLFTALVEGQERHVRKWADTDKVRFRAYAPHPGPNLPATRDAAWLEALGYRATEWGASLVRPHLDDIPERRLPDGVEVRPVAHEDLRTIWDAEWEAFRGEWDSREMTDDDFLEFIGSPHHDPSMWKVAWAGDTVVGQVKSYINRDENEARGYLRGYTEYISTHHDWRNRGIAGALLAMSLGELKDRGMTEAALGVDTNNPGGAFQLYTGLGFELRAYEAVYTKPISG